MLGVNSTWVAGLALSLGVGSCRRMESARDLFGEEAERVRAATTPMQAQVLGWGVTRREALRVTREWRLGEDVDWTEFAVAARLALAATYRCTSEEAMVRCTRSLPGDHFSVEFTPDGPGRVRVTLEARPD